MSKAKPNMLSRLFTRGLGIFLPLALTVSLLAWLWAFIMNNVIGRVEMLVRMIPGSETWPEWAITSLSAVALFSAILLMGIWFSGFLGKRLFELFERLLGRIPLLGSIYPYIKQITEFFFGKERAVEFKRVVALPYPRKGVYSLGFLTGSSLKSLREGTGNELISVFVPSSPMPATGYTLFVPPDDLLEINMNVEEALRTIISGGVLVPPQEMLENAKPFSAETE